jgi:CubicO group peptidase (beta-lactamase class C family)
VTEFLQEIKEQKFDLHAFIIIKGDKVLAEGYSEPFNKDYHHRVYSSSKSYSAIAIGKLIGEGKAKLTDKLIDFFPEYKLKRNQEQLKEVTIENFLTMTVPYKFKSEPWTKICTSGDWGGKALEHVGGKEQIGERFHYSTLGIQVLSNVLAKATDMSLKEFATNYLFEPLEIIDVPDANVYDRASQEAFYKARDNRG